MDSKVEDIGTKGIKFTRLDELSSFERLWIEIRETFRVQEEQQNAEGWRSKESLKRIRFGRHRRRIGIVGAGVFVLTGTAAKENAGPALIVSYLIAMRVGVHSVVLQRVRGYVRADERERV